jgi:hypothetical protein
MSEQATSIYKKIAQVILHDATKQIAKSKKGFSTDDVYAALRNAMAENNLICMPQFEGYDGEWIHFKFTLFDADSGDSITSDWYQLLPKPNGMMTIDKCVGAASTYAHKYFLMRTFMLTSSDDPQLDKTPAVTDTHWTTERDQMEAFYEQCKKLDPVPKNKEQIFEALEVPYLAAYNGTMADAIQTVNDHMQEIARMATDEPNAYTKSTELASQKGLGDVTQAEYDKKLNELCTSLMGDKDIQKYYKNFSYVQNAVNKYIDDPFVKSYDKVRSILIEHGKEKASESTEKLPKSKNEGKQGTSLDEIPF